MPPLASPVRFRQSVALRQAFVWGIAAVLAAGEARGQLQLS